MSYEYCKNILGLYYVFGVLNVEPFYDGQRHRPGALAKLHLGPWPYNYIRSLRNDFDKDRAYAAHTKCEPALGPQTPPQDKVDWTPSV